MALPAPSEPIFRPRALRALDAAGIVYKLVQHREDGSGDLEALTDCPDCGKERHFYVNIYMRVGYCQRDGISFTWNELEKLWSLPKVSEAAPKLRELRDRLVGGQPIRGVNGDGDIPAAEFPMGTYQAWRFPKAVAYLEERRIPLRAALLHDLRYCPFGVYAERLLFPIFWQRRLVGFQARCMVPRCPDCAQGIHPKYVFSAGFPAGRILYPERHLRVERAWLVEGVIPALQLTGLATFGKKFSTDQFALLKAHSGDIREVVLAFDRDAWSKQRLPIDDVVGLPKKKRWWQRVDDPPAQRVFKQVSKQFHCIAFVFPKDAPQPDHIRRRRLVAAADAAFKASRGESSVWQIDRRGRTERQS